MEHSRALRAPAPLPAPPDGSTPGRRTALRSLSPGRRGGQPGRYKVTLRNGQEQLEVDSNLGRLKRCQRRIHAWAKAIPSANRYVRRRNKKVNIGPRMVMLTLTYRNAGDWRPNQIRDYLIALREVLGDKLYAYAWVLEMQQRGAPHYHILVYVARGTDVPKPDAGLWSYGSSKRETARTIYYICKYTSNVKQKEYQKHGFPPGARMFAVKIYITDLTDDALFDFRASSAPKWLYPHLREAYSHVGIELRWIRQKGGGWTIVQTGETLISPWHVVSVERIN